MALLGLVKKTVNLVPVIFTCGQSDLDYTGLLINENGGMACCF